MTPSAPLGVDEATHLLWATCNWYTTWLLYEDDPDRDEASIARWYETTLAAMLLP